MEAFVSGSEVYRLLMQRNMVDSEGNFIWEDKEEGGVYQELNDFWSSESENRNAMEDTVDLGEKVVGDVVLPEDIMPSFQKMVVDERDQIKDTRSFKKQKVWGPVQPTRQSSRINRSTSVMEKAQEMQRRKNLEQPARKMSGISRTNPFNALQWDSLQNIARTIGVDILEEPDRVVVDDGEDDLGKSVSDRSIHDAVVDNAAVVTPPSSPGENVLDDLADGWTEVIRKSRGKHPRKKLL